MSAGSLSIALSTIAVVVIVVAPRWEKTLPGIPVAWLGAVLAVIVAFLAIGLWGSLGRLGEQTELGLTALRPVPDLCGRGHPDHRGRRPRRPDRVGQATEARTGSRTSAGRAPTNRPLPRRTPTRSHPRRSWLRYRRTPRPNRRRRPSHRIRPSGTRRPSRLPPRTTTRGPDLGRRSGDRALAERDAGPAVAFRDDLGEDRQARSPPARGRPGRARPARGAGPGPPR